MNSTEKTLILQENNSFVNELETINTPEELQALLAKYDIELSLNEVHLLIAEASTAKDKLSEKDLDKISGGAIPIIALQSIAAKIGTWGIKTITSWAISKALSNITGL